MEHKISLALRVTNWCNLNCRHCCTVSGPSVRPNFMPRENIRKYIEDFLRTDYPKWQYNVVFTGGETFASYYHGDFNYIKYCIDTACTYGMAPSFKTNGLFGGDERLRSQIIMDLAYMAHKHQTPMMLDISIDEFHPNRIERLNIVTDIMKNKYTAAAIKMSFVGLNTFESRQLFVCFLTDLQRYGFMVVPHRNKTVTIARGDIRVEMLYEFDAPLTRAGRAIQNNLGDVNLNGKPDPEAGHCLEITNYDTAILNYTHSTSLRNKTLSQAIEHLIQKTI